MSYVIPVSEDVEKIIRALPPSTIDQKIYKAKIVFLGVDKGSQGYNPIKDFQANCNPYRVVDGEIAYLPEEAYNALSDAIEQKRVPLNRKQEVDGINGAVREKYGVKLLPRFDLTIIDTYKQAVVDNRKCFVSEKAELTAKDNKETMDAVLKIKEAELRKSIEEEIRAEYEAKQLPPAITDDDITKIVNGDIE